MTKTPTAAEKLAARVASLSTAKLIEVHGLTLLQYYKAPRDQVEVHSIVLDALIAELERRKVPMNLCCYCPAPHHDARICDRNGPTPLTEAADVIMKGLDSVR